MAGRSGSPLPAVIHMTGAHGVARPTTNGPPAFEATACRAQAVATAINCVCA